MEPSTLPEIGYQSSAKRLPLIASLPLVLALFCGCSSSGGDWGGGGGIHGEGLPSSEPINATEAREYKRALLRCHKTGGTRIVKIMGKLRCY